MKVLKLWYKQLKCKHVWKVASYWDCIYMPGVPDFQCEKCGKFDKSGVI